MARFLDPTLLLLVCLALALGGWLVLGPHPKLGTGFRARMQLAVRILAPLATIGLWVMSTPYFSYRLVAYIEPDPPRLDEVLDKRGSAERVLVVLGGDMNGTSRRFPPIERLGEHTFRRTIHAARIYREFGFKSVIVSGSHGRPRPLDMTGAMRDLLVMAGVPPDRLVLEAQSLNTRQNAEYVYRILADLEFAELVLVTSAVHMPRAQAEFERVGLNPIPAPADYVPYPNQRFIRLLPSSQALATTARGVHEVVGRVKP